MNTKKFLFFTSAVIMCMACPAFAENFPQDGNMLENKTYDNAATYANTGIYEGDVTADAEYSLNPYSVSAGSYFTGIDNNNDATISTCTAGNFCPGVSSTTYENSAFGDTGLRACPANYSGSATGATANTDCYRACSTTDVAKSATVSGQMYYNGTSGDGVNACVPETCVAGWHKKDAVPNLNTAIGTASAENSAWVNGAGTFKENTLSSDATTHGQAFYELTENNTWAVNYGSNGIIIGQARLSTREGIPAWTWQYNTIPENFVNELPEDNTGTYCYCRLTGYKPANGTLQSVSSPWMFSREEHYNCLDECVNNLRFNTTSAFRQALFNSLGTPGPASCEANTINITWNDASAEDIAATGAATTVYEGDIKTPLKAVTKPGKTFVGWKFIKPTNPAPVQGEGD